MIFLIECSVVGLMFLLLCKAHRYGESSQYGQLIQAQKRHTLLFSAKRRQKIIPCCFLSIFLYITYQWLLRTWLAITADNGSHASFVPFPPILTRHAIPRQSDSSAPLVALSNILQQCPHSPLIHSGMHNGAQDAYYASLHPSLVLPPMFPIDINNSAQSTVVNICPAPTNSWINTLLHSVDIPLRTSIPHPTSALYLLHIPNVRLSHTLNRLESSLKSKLVVWEAHASPFIFLVELTEETLVLAEADPSVLNVGRFHFLNAFCEVARYLRFVVDKDNFSMHSTLNQTHCFTTDTNCLHPFFLRLMLCPFLYKRQSFESSYACQSVASARFRCTMPPFTSSKDHASVRADNFFDIYYYWVQWYKFAQEHKLMNHEADLFGQEDGVHTTIQNEYNAQPEEDSEDIRIGPFNRNKTWKNYGRFSVQAMFRMDSLKAIGQQAEDLARNWLNSLPVSISLKSTLLFKGSSISMKDASSYSLKLNIQPVNTNRIVINFFLLTQDILPDFFYDICTQSVSQKSNSTIFRAHRYPSWLGPFCYSIYSMFHSLIQHPLLLHLESVADYRLDRANARYFHLADWPSDPPAPAALHIDFLTKFERVSLRGERQIVSIGDAGVDLQHCDLYDSEYIAESLNKSASHSSFRDAYFSSSPQPASSSLYVDGRPFASRQEFNEALLKHRKLVGYWDLIDRVDNFHGTHTTGSLVGEHAWADPERTAAGKSRGLAYRSKVLVKDLMCTSGDTKMVLLNGTTVPACSCTAWRASACAGLNKGQFMKPVDAQKIPVSENLYVPFDLVNDYFSVSKFYESYIHSESWGSHFDGSYSTPDYEVDEFSLRNPHHLLIFSAGNLGTVGHRLINSPSSGKNVLSVGALTPFQNGWESNMNEEEYMNFVANFASKHHEENMDSSSPRSLQVEAGMFKNEKLRIAFNSLFLSMKNQTEDMSSIRTATLKTNASERTSSARSSVATQPYLNATVSPHAPESSLFAHSTYYQLNQFNADFNETFVNPFGVNSVYASYPYLLFSLFSKKYCYKYFKQCRTFNGVYLLDPSSQTVACNNLNYACARLALAATTPPKATAKLNPTAADGENCCDLFKYFESFEEWEGSSATDNMYLGCCETTMFHEFTQSAWYSRWLRMKVPSFSSRGPTFDNRVKPDVVALGSPLESSWPYVAPCDTYHRPSSDLLLDKRRQLLGASFAVPVVAALATLVRQYFMDGFYPSGTRNASHEWKGDNLPSGALIKAVLINSAEPLASSLVDREAAIDRFSNEGFGAIRLSKGLYIAEDGVNGFSDRSEDNAYTTHKQNSPHNTQNFRIFVHDNKKGIIERETCIYTINFSMDALKKISSFREENQNPTSNEYTTASAAPLQEHPLLSVTLTWYDAPSLPGRAISLVNDLDLEVMFVTNASSKREKHFHYGNEEILPKGERDSLNTVERITLYSIPSTLTKAFVYVKANRVLSDTQSIMFGSSTRTEGKGEDMRQPYALVVKGPIQDPSVYTVTPNCSVYSVSRWEITRGTLLKSWKQHEKSMLTLCNFKPDASANPQCTLSCKIAIHQLMETLAKIETLPVLSRHDHFSVQYTKEALLGKVLSACVLRIEKNFDQQVQKAENASVATLMNYVNDEVEAIRTYLISEFPQKIPQPSNTTNSSPEMCRWNFFDVAGAIVTSCMDSRALPLIQSLHSLSSMFLVSPSSLRLNMPLNCSSICAEQLCNVVHQHQHAPTRLLHPNCFNQYIYFSWVDGRDLHFKELVENFATQCNIVCIFSTRSAGDKGSEKMVKFWGIPLADAERDNCGGSSCSTDADGFYWLMWAAGSLSLLFVGILASILQLKSTRALKRRLDNLKRTSEE